MNDYSIISIVVATARSINIVVGFLHFFHFEKKNVKINLYFVVYVPTSTCCYIQCFLILISIDLFLWKFTCFASQARTHVCTFLTHITSAKNIKINRNLSVGNSSAAKKAVCIHVCNDKRTQIEYGWHNVNHWIWQVSTHSFLHQYFSLSFFSRSLVNNFNFDAVPSFHLCTKYVWGIFFSLWPI